MFNFFYYKDANLLVYKLLYLSCLIISEKTVARKTQIDLVWIPDWSSVPKLSFNSRVTEAFTNSYNNTKDKILRGILCMSYLVLINLVSEQYDRELKCRFSILFQGLRIKRVIVGKGFGSEMRAQSRDVKSARNWIAPVDRGGHFDLSSNWIRG